MLNLTKQEKMVLLFVACAVIFGIALSRIQKNNPRFSNFIVFKLKQPQSKINLNQAALKELTDIPGVGDALAGRIIEYRDVYGGFKDIEEVKKVKGIGQQKFESMRERLIVE